MFRGRGRLRSMRSCMKPRGTFEAPRKIRGKRLADCRHLRKVRGRPLRIRDQPLGLRDEGRETKSLLQHLINLTEERGGGATGKPLRKKDMADNTIQAVNDGNFEAEVLTASNSKPVMVGFWAEWCRPGPMLAPSVGEIAHDYEGKLKVTKLNVDEAMNSAGRYNIRGIPTLLAFKNGQVVEQIVGAVAKEQIT